MADTPQFSEPLLLGFLSNFCIPKTFLKHLGLGESNTSNDFVVVLKDKLSSCAGNGEQKTWRVKVDSDGRRFLDGWQEFADDHSLRVGEFLVFYYVGGFVFEVLVFDSVSAYARSLSAEKTGDVEFRVEKMVHSLSAGEIRDVGPRREKSTHSLSAEETGEIEFRGEMTAHSVSSGEPGDVEFIGEKSTHSLSVEKTGDVELRGKKSTCTCERAGFKPSRHPYFRASVKQYCFKWHAMLIPTQFARLHNLAKRWCEMKLIDQENRAWTINLRHRKTGKDQVYLASGWDAFSIANKLKVEDSVVFELIDSGSEPVMKFYKTEM